MKQRISISSDIHIPGSAFSMGIYFSLLFLGIPCSMWGTTTTFFHCPKQTKTLLGLILECPQVPFGIDFGMPTGHFTKTVVDIIEQQLGLGFSPPYLAPATTGSMALKGGNYASGAARSLITLARFLKFVSEVHKKDWKLCLPFPVKESEEPPTFPPSEVPKFRWWGCDNCRHEVATEGITDEIHQKDLNHCSTGCCSNSSNAVFDMHYQLLPILILKKLQRLTTFP